MVNAFTVDLEDYYHVSAFEHLVDRRRWHEYESRIERSTHRLLRLLDRCAIRATFFVLGWVAERFPQLVQDIARDGHEIGSHSYWHRLIYKLSPDEFRRDLRQSRRVLEDLLGTRIDAFRAPSFSVTRQSLWALNILREEGFEYDSSVYPVHHDRYGIPGAQRFPHVIENEGGALCEFPPTTFRLGRTMIPVGGGGYFRLYPIGWTCRMLARINQDYQQPFMFYVHPWELDPDQPRMPGISRATRFRHYVNLHSTERKLERLCASFSFSTMSDVLQSVMPAVNSRGWPVTSSVVDKIPSPEIPPFERPGSSESDANEIAGGVCER
jgi:polysaccharide deacetylase family protein (PEP-CTERM system associated)